MLHSDGFADPATGYAAYIDVDSFVRWYLVNEVFRNVDANMWSSCWMYKPRGGKLFMGPLWDFDLAAGNVELRRCVQDGRLAHPRLRRGSRACSKTRRSSRA